MTELTEREIWDCATALIELHADLVGDHIVERLRALNEAGDFDGMKIWFKIADRVELLCGAGNAAIQ